MSDELRSDLAEDLRRFRLKGRPGFRDEALSVLSDLQVVRNRAASTSKNDIDCTIDALVEEAISEAVGTGKQGVAIRLHLGYDPIPDQLLSSIALNQGVSKGDLVLRHKERTEAAAFAFPYSIDHYMDAVLPGITTKLLNYLLNLENAETTYSAAKHFFHIRDIFQGESLFGNFILTSTVTLTGIITRRVKQKRVLFLDIADGTGTIQLMALQESKSVWDDALTFPARSRVAVKGELSRSSTGQLSVALSSIAEHRSRYFQQLEDSDPPAPTEVYLARLENHSRHELALAGFTEIGTRLISNTWPDEGVDVMRITYDGYGQPFYLTPSPAPQLVRSLIDLPYGRVFTITRSFTPTYRDPHVSSEAVILGGAASNLSIIEVLELCNGLAVALYESDETAPITEHQGRLVVKPEVPWPGVGEHTAVETPEIQVFSYDVERDGNQRTQIARLCWPYEGSEDYFQADYAEYILGEGYSEIVDSESSLTCFVLNIERLLAVLLEGCNIRRIPALGEPDTHA